MSFTETKMPPINEVVVIEDGITEANLSIKRLCIIPQVDGSRLIKVEKGDKLIRFILNEYQCIHLASLLNPNEELTGRGDGKLENKAVLWPRSG